MEIKIKKTFEVIQMIPSTTYVTYLVEASDEQEAEELVDNHDDSVDLVGESTVEDHWGGIEYQVNQIIQDGNE
jgi:hypothetical protein